MGQRTVVLELAGDHQLARDLVAGGVFVPGEQLRLGEPCTLVLRGKGAELSLGATCVWVDARGTGLQLADCDGEMKLLITRLARAATADQEREAYGDRDSSDDMLASGSGEMFAAATDPDALAIEEALAALSPEDLEDPVPHGDGPDTEREFDDEYDCGAGDGDRDSAGDDRVPQSVNERLRGLTLVQQLKVAQYGELSERVLLERMYGKNVWEALLRNPRITGPEVARIARMGALPRPLLELVVGNGGWLQIPEVRRALLSNPRLGTDQILRVLRLLPKHELKLAAMQTAYPYGVRDAAKRLLRELGGA